MAPGFAEAAAGEIAKLADLPFVSAPGAEVKTIAVTADGYPVAWKCRRETRHGKWNPTVFRQEEDGDQKQSAVLCTSNAMDMEMEISNT